MNEEIEHRTWPTVPTEEEEPDQAQATMTAIGDQIAQVWSGLMSAMTAQGATRDQIMEVALATSAAILGLTGDALWADDAVVPHQERESFTNFRELRRMAISATEDISRT